MRARTLIILTAAFTILIVGFAVLITGSGSTKAVVGKTAGAKITLDHKDKQVGDIGYSSGILYHKFPIKNTGTEDLEIANMATSCMCTKTYLEIDGKDSPQFGMKGMSQPSDWKGILKPGESGVIIAAFDPAYHGPSGIGPVQRTVSFETNDPNNPYVEVGFEGVVTK